jgi:hypothetical protein
MGKYIWLPYFRGLLLSKWAFGLRVLKKIKGLAIKYNSER